MSTAHLETAIAATRAQLAATTAGQLDLPTPCASWKVRDLINHVIGAQHFFHAGAAGTPPNNPGADFASGDFVAAFDEAAGRVLAAFQVEGVMAKTLTTPLGPMPGAAFADLAATDSFVHGWDLAKATGRSTDLEPELAAALLQRGRKAIPDAMRGPDGKAPFGAKVEAPAGASSADQLAAFLGREL